MSLKTKARIYRWTAIYLASAEEYEYLNRADTRAKILAWANDPEMDMTYDDACGLATGLWHTQHGFFRPISFHSFNKPSWFWRPIGYICEFLILVRWALERK